MVRGIIKKTGGMVLATVVGAPLILAVGATQAFAQGYVPLAPLPGVKAGTGLGEYIQTLFQIGIGIAGVLAVLMLVVAGIEYIGGAGNPAAKSDAKERIRNALFGLILALSSWLILNTLNPDLLKTGLDIKKAVIKKAPSSSSGGGGSGESGDPADDAENNDDED
ncbi:MAG: hypothetical protein BMS9Abin13_454 [Patescibacteria group bacterium]|nr:MAG: hypothetical protein BMS9Abin13_454 [Patescibacteria group bacterium]